MRLLDQMSPMPATLEEAREEILALRIRLLQSNEKWAKAAEAVALARRQLSALQKRVSLSDNKAVAFKYISNHFLNHPKFHWFTRRDIAQEIDQLGNGEQGADALSTKKTS